MVGVGNNWWRCTSPGIRLSSGLWANAKRESPVPAIELGLLHG